MSHIILLVQTQDSPMSRTYLDFPTPTQAWSAIVLMFEDRLKLMTPGLSKIVYDIQQLFGYLDSLPDVSCLIQDRSTKSYIPQPREYIKAEIFNHLKNQAGGGGGGGGGRGGGGRR